MVATSGLTGRTSKLPGFRYSAETIPGTLRLKENGVELQRCQTRRLINFQNSMDYW